MDLQAYLDRIGFAGTPRADLATLREIHRRHLMAIPYENLDVQLGRPVGLDPAAAFAKLVTARRGGWCYEMNGLLGAMLQEIGFSVTRMAGAVMRDERGPESIGNHLVLRVDLDRPYIADVGFGDGILEPVPLAPGAYSCAGYDFRVEQLNGTWWRFHNHAMGGAPYFDFTLTPASDARLTGVCDWLRTSPDSIFVQTAVCFRHTPDGLIALLGRMLRQVRPGEKSQRVLSSADEFVAVLKRDFRLDLPEAAALWPAICARHEELFPPETRPSAGSTVRS